MINPYIKYRICRFKQILYKISILRILFYVFIVLCFNSKQVLAAEEDILKAGKVIAEYKLSSQRPTSIGNDVSPYNSVEERDTTKKHIYKFNGQKLRITEIVKTYTKYKASEALLEAARGVDQMLVESGQAPTEVKKIKKQNNESSYKSHITNTFINVLKENKMVTSSKKTHRLPKNTVSVIDKQKIGPLGWAQIKACKNNWYPFDGENPLVGCAPLNKILKNRWKLQSASELVPVFLKSKSYGEFRQVKLKCHNYSPTGRSSAGGVTVEKNICVNRQWGIPIVVKISTRMTVPESKAPINKSTQLIRLDLVPDFSQNDFDMKANQVCNKAPKSIGKWSRCRYKGKPRKQDDAWMHER